MTNTLAYFDIESIMTVKSVMHASDKYSNLLQYRICYDCKCFKVEELASDKHSSLFQYRINYNCKMFYLPVTNTLVYFDTQLIMSVINSVLK